MLAPHAAMRVQRLTHGAWGKKRGVVHLRSPVWVSPMARECGRGATWKMEGKPMSSCATGQGGRRPRSGFAPSRNKTAGREARGGHTELAGVGRRDGMWARRDVEDGGEANVVLRHGTGRTASAKRLRPPPGTRQREARASGWAHTHRIVFTQPVSQVDTITQPITLALKSQEKSSRRDGRCCDLASGRRGGGRMDASL